MAGEEVAFKTVRDDIPVARRSISSRRSGIFIYFSISFFVLVTGTLFWLGRTNGWTGSGIEREEQLNSKIGQFSEDGRLLGHFPYSEASEESLVLFSPGLKMHSETAKAYKEMRSAAAQEGISLILLSAYRSHQLQKEIFFEIKSQRNQTALERSKVSAPPGHSEHSTGYAIDIGDANRPDTDFEESFENTPAFRWLKRNASRYHFTLSFPPDNHQGVTYEPWHWRFEGTADALREFEKANKHSRMRQ